MSDFLRATLGWFLLYWVCSFIYMIFGGYVLLYWVLYKLVLKHHIAELKAIRRQGVIRRSAA